MVDISNEQVKEIVRENYSRVAQDASSACCETSLCCDSTDLYSIQEIQGLPNEAVMASAGCGNPTAIGTLQPGETVVDFGSGGGIDCFLSAKAVGPEGRVIGVDMTPDMVNLARKNAKTLDLDNVEFHLTEMESTPLDDDIADVIISNCVINLAPDKTAVFQEAFRVLKPGGRMFISDMVLTEELPQEVSADMSKWVQCLSGAELKDVYLGRMKSVGFVNVEVVAQKPYYGDDDIRSKIHSMNILAYKPA